MHKNVITDSGTALRVQWADGRTITIPRYGAWVWNAARQRHDVAEASDDLEGLMKKYAVPRSHVINVPWGEM